MQATVPGLATLSAGGRASLPHALLLLLPCCPALTYRNGVGITLFCHIQQCIHPQHRRRLRGDAWHWANAVLHRAVYYWWFWREICSFSIGRVVLSDVRCDLLSVCVVFGPILRPSPPHTHTIIRHRVDGFNKNFAAQNAKTSKHPHYQLRAAVLLGYPDSDLLLYFVLV